MRSGEEETWWWSEDAAPSRRENKVAAGRAVYSQYGIVLYCMERPSGRMGIGVNGELAVYRPGLAVIHR